MDATVIERYRKLRKKYPRLPANQAAIWARTEAPEDAVPGLTWDRNATNYTPRGIGHVDGFDVVIAMDYDQFAEPDGSFTDSWSEDVVPNPDWGPGAYNMLRYYSPLNSWREEWKYNRAHLSRHEAYIVALQHAREDAERDKQVEAYVITVTVSVEDVELAEESVGGFKIGPNSTSAEDRDYLISSALEILDEALANAKATAKSIGPKLAGLVVEDPRTCKFCGAEIERPVGVSEWRETGTGYDVCPDAPLPLESHEPA